MIPDESSPPPARGSVIGDNSGTPVEQARALQREALDDTLVEGKTFAERKAEFLTSASRQVVRDRHSAAAAADTIKLAADVWELIDADRRTRSDPYREAHLALSGMATEFWAPVVEAMRGLREQIDQWTAAEDDRIAAQRREQQEQMDAMRARSTPPTPPSGRAKIDYAASAPQPRAAAPAMRPAKRAPIRGDLGATISAKDAVTYEIEDFALLPEHILRSPTVVEAILTVVRSTARHMGVPAGIRAVTTTGNQIR